MTLAINSSMQFDGEIGPNDNITFISEHGYEETLWPKKSMTCHASHFDKLSSDLGSFLVKYVTTTVLTYINRFHNGFKYVCRKYGVDIRDILQH